MGQTSCKQQAETLDLIYQDLKNALANHDSPEEQKKSSAAYLELATTKARYIEIMEGLTGEVRAIACNMLGLTYVELGIGHPDSGDFCVLNFWPCRDCVCIAVQYPNRKS